MTENKTIITHIHDLERKWGMKVFEEDLKKSKKEAVFSVVSRLFSFQVGSHDKNRKKKAERALEIAWEATAEVDANAETVTAHDMTEEYEALFPTAADKNAAMRGLMGFEFTRGCNGGCDFCYFGKKKGVTKRYSMESIKKFFSKYGKNINSYSNASFIISYGDSDFLDWKDIGEYGTKYGAVDIYRIYRDKGLTKMLNQLTTSVPRGSQKEFVNLIKEVVKDKLAGNISFKMIRLSIGKHNIRRVESCLEKIKLELLEEGINEQDIDYILLETFYIVSRSKDSNMKVGDHIEEADPYTDLDTVNSSDGLFLSPENISAVVMTASTLFTPSGLRRYIVNGADSVPAVKLLLNHSVFFPTTSESSDWLATDENIINLCGRRSVFLPALRSQESDRLFITPDSNLDDSEFKEKYLDDLCFLISREVLSLNTFLKLTKNILNNFSSLQEDTTKLFFRTAIREWNNKNSYISMILEKLKAIETSDFGEQTKIEYFITLIELSRNKVNLILDAYEQSTSEAIFISEVVTDIGLEHKDKFSEVFEDMDNSLDNEKFDDLVKNIDEDIDLFSLGDSLREIFDKHRLNFSFYYAYIKHIDDSNFEVLMGDIFPLVKDMNSLLEEVKPFFDPILNLKKEFRERMASRYGEIFDEDNVFSFLNKQLLGRIDKKIVFNIKWGVNI